MKSLRPLWRELSLLYFKRALAEMPKLHSDVPMVVLRIRALEAERRMR